MRPQISIWPFERRVDRGQRLLIGRLHDRQERQDAGVFDLEAVEQFAFDHPVDCVDECHVQSVRTRRVRTSSSWPPRGRRWSLLKRRTHLTDDTRQPIHEVVERDAAQSGAEVNHRTEKAEHRRHAAHEANQRVATVRVLVVEIGQVLQVFAIVVGRPFLGHEAQCRGQTFADLRFLQPLRLRANSVSNACALAAGSRP